MPTASETSARGSESGPFVPTADEREAVAQVLRAIPMAAVAHTLDYQLIAVNEDCATLLRVSMDDIVGLPVENFIPIADRHTALEAARAVAAMSSSSVRPPSTLRRLINGEGQELTCWMHIGLATIGGYRCFIACLDLVNPVLSDAHRWRHRAEHDELTGLARRGTLIAQVSQWINSGRVVLLAFLDIDNFKAINDTHGHAAGDRVLTTLARRLEEYAPDGCLVSRLSGDEFVLAVIVPAPAGTDEFDESLRTTTETLRAVGPLCVAEPVAWGDHLLALSVSEGVTVSGPGEDPSKLLSRADKAMYAQKALLREPRA